MVIWGCISNVIHLIYHYSSLFLFYYSLRIMFTFVGCNNTEKCVCDITVTACFQWRPLSTLADYKQKAGNLQKWFKHAIHTYLLASWSRVLENVTSSELVKKIPTFYGTLRFITASTRSHHLSLSWARSIQSMPPCPNSGRSILLLTSHLCRGIPSGLFPSGFPTKTLHAHLPSPTSATCPTHLILLDMIIRTKFGEEYISVSSSLCSFIYSRYLIPLRSKYTPQHPILKHPQPMFIPQYKQPSFTPIQNNRQNYSSVYLNLYIFGQQTGRQKFLHQMIASPYFNLLLISSWIEFWFVSVAPKHLNCSTLMQELLSIFLLWLCPSLWSRDMTM